MPSTRVPAPRSGAPTALGQPVVDDWNYLVRVSRPADLEAVLASTGFRAFPGTSPRSGHPVAGANGVTGIAEVDEETADRRLASLVADAAEDPLAARIVLQRLLPGLLSIARRRGGRHGALTLRLYHELLGNAWLVIRCYPIERRPHRVAANILRDVEYQTFVREARLSRVRPESWDATALEDLDLGATAAGTGRDPHPFEEVVDALSDAKQAGAHPDAVRFAAAIASGRSLRELAEDRKVTVRAERYRREQVMSELRTLLDPTRQDDAPA